jgi:hypothetical protein
VPTNAQAPQPLLQRVAEVKAKAKEKKGKK